MWAILLEWFGSRAWEPHGHCFLWTPSLLWTLVGSNLLIAAAYYSIPLVLLTMVRKRSDLVHRPTFMLFAAFIFGCGTTHLVKVWTIWQPVYSLQGTVDVATAGVSVLTAIVLWPLLPRFLAIPSPEQLRRTNQALEMEIAERKEVEAALRRTRDELEQRVEERTAEIRQKNQQLEQEIAERIQTESALRQSEERFRQLADSMPQLVWTADPDGTVDYYNQRVQEFQGICRDDGRWTWSPVLHPEDQQPTADAWQNAVDTGIPYEIEHRVNRADGELRWYLSRAVPARNDEGEIVKWYGTATDIHAQKEVEAERNRLIDALNRERAQLQKMTETLEVRVKERTEQVRSLAAKLSLAEHEERKRIAQILHDHVQQMLYGVQMRAHLIGLELPSSGAADARAHVKTMQQLTTEAIRATRTLTVELSPPVLEEEGLPEAVAWLGNQMKELHDLELVVNVSGDCQVQNKSLRVLIFQIVRELLFNVVKHAGVDTATVTLERSGADLVAVITDRGRGFDTNTIDGSRGTHLGFGLSSIRERLQLFGGSLHIVSAPGAGTQVEVQLRIV